ncbi:MAG: TIGR02186 family protein [Methylobacterium sp.]
MLMVGPAAAQEPAPAVAAPAAADAGGSATPPSVETFEIGLSTETISVGAGFGGARLVVFGALDNADQRILRQGRYDIVVVLEGPKRDLVVREKRRFFGLWVNRGSERFQGVPLSYSLASTRPVRDIAPPVTLRQLSLGLDDLGFERASAGQARTGQGTDYADALRRLKIGSGLYTEAVGAIEFVSSTLFRANLVLPPDMPVGRHVARAILFREGTFVRERSEDLWVVKTGLENQISVFAARNGVLYGVLAVAVAIFTGWFGRIIFKRD